MNFRRFPTNRARALFAVGPLPMVVAKRSVAGSQEVGRSLRVAACEQTVVEAVVGCFVMWGSLEFSVASFPWAL